MQCMLQPKTANNNAKYIASMVGGPLSIGPFTDFQEPVNSRTYELELSEYNPGITI